MDWSAPAAWAPLLASLQIGATDLALRPERWETRLTIPGVEAVLRDPLSGPAFAGRIEAAMAGAGGSAGLVAAGFDALGVVPAPPGPPGTAPVSAPPSSLPADLRAPLAALTAGILDSRRELAAALSSLTPEERARARDAAEAALRDDPFLVPDAADFDAAGRFDQARLAAAGLAAARAADAALPALAAVRPGKAFSVRWPTPAGEVIVSSGDAVLRAADLEGAALVVRLGGKTRYEGPAAVAGEGQVRVVIDLGGPATIASSEPSAGSAEFGVALLYLLGPGPHSVEAGPRSLGAARFGVAYARVDGDGSRLASGRFGQGAAAFGAGVLDTRGARAALRLPLAGQGFGTTRGAGLWRHRGDDLDAVCGLSIPDPREGLGFQSMGQGAGMGPRAYAAGGIGAARVAGDRARLTGSYFAQGTGYWRGLGALFVRGDGARLRARRYSLGAGVHSAAGVLDVAGKDADLATWGVGFGFGWDYGVGLFRLRGDGARARADWAAGRGDLGGRGLAWIEGDGGRYALPDLGTGSYTRSAAGYGLALVRGSGGRMAKPGLKASAPAAASTRTGPWGVLDAEGLTLDPALALPAPEWPEPDRAAGAAAEAPRTARLLAQTPADALGRMKRLLFAASAAVLDPRPAQSAAAGLLSLDAEDAPALAAAVDPERFDELIWANLAAAGLGPAAARAAAAEAARATGLRRVTLLGWAAGGRAAEGLPPAEAALRDPEWRARRIGAAALAGLFGEEGGDEWGRLRYLRALAAGKGDPPEVRRKYVASFYSALALAGAPTAEERLSLLEKARTPFDAAASEAVAAFAELVRARPPLRDALAAEVRAAEGLRARALAALRPATEDAEDEVAAAALNSLGGFGEEADARRLVAALASPSSLRREAAASGLSRLGPVARDAIASALKAPEPRARALAASAAARSWDAGSFRLIARALDDRDAAVRAAAAAAVGQAQGTLEGEKKKLRGPLERLASKDPDGGVRAAAALAAAAIAP